MGNERQECNHEGPYDNVTCCKEAGHHGNHIRMVDGKKPNECTVFEWNDDKEVKPADLWGKFEIKEAGPAGLRAAVAEAMADAKRNLISGNVFEIRSTIPVDKFIAWYFSKNPKDMPSGFEKFGMEQEPLFMSPETPIAMDLAGYSVLARVKI